MNKFFLYILAFWGVLAIGQDDYNQLHDHRLNEKKWGEIRDNIRYEDGRDAGPGRQWTYESDEEYNQAQRDHEAGNGSGRGSWERGRGAERRERESQPRRDYDAPDFNGPSMDLSWFGWVMIILLLGALVFLIVQFFLNIQRDGKQVTVSDDFEEINPAEIPQTELERLLSEALAEKDYRGAVRIYFIFIVKDLSLKGLIQWEREKTNFQYLREMFANAHYEDFNRSVSYFEYIWYGKREIDQDAFNKIQPSFTQFLNKLGVK